MEAPSAWRPQLLNVLYVALSCATALIVRRFYHRFRLRAFPRVGIEPGLLGLKLQISKDEFYENGYELVSNGYKQFPDSPFLVQTSDMERLIIPMHLATELKDLPSSKLSHKAALLDRFQGKYTGLNAVQANNVHRDVCKVQLTQNLAEIIPRMKADMDFFLEKALEQPSTGGSVTVPAFELVLHTIAQITSGVIVNNPVGRSQEWIDTIVGYPEYAAIQAMVLRRQAPYLRSFISPFLSSTKRVKNCFATARRLLIPIIATRRKGISKDKPLDLLQWLSEAEPLAPPEKLIGKVLFLALAAVHTSTFTTVHALYDLCSLPGLIEVLREEAREILEPAWSLRALHQLRKMDSFLKESHRVNSPGVLNYNRLLHQNITLSNGTVLPSGVLISVAGAARSKDPELVPSPEILDPLRYHEMGKGKTKDDSNNHFSSVAQGDSWFGYGRQACPGRWYAEAQIKLILVTLILKFDIEFPKDQSSRPPNIHADEKILPDTKQKIEFRRRI